MVVSIQNEQQLLLKEMIYRLKTRLALANFKRQYGYERYDLYTLENNLLVKKKKVKPSLLHGRHRYYPTHTNTNRLPITNNKRIMQQTLYLRYPLSEKRSTSPQQHHKTVIRTDEDAANVLVMLHNMS